MTNVTFYKKNNNIIGFSCLGHSNFAEYGSDIVCASISAITQSAVLGLTKVLNLKCNYKTDDKKGSLECWLPNIENAETFSNAQAILNTTLVALKDLEKGYPLNIKVEVKN